VKDSAVGAGAAVQGEDTVVSDDDGATIAAGAAGGATAARVGGGGSGSSGSGSGGGDDDDDKLIPAWGVPGDWQIILLGLLTAGLLFFGTTIWGWFFGDDDVVESVDAPIAAAAVVSSECASVLEQLEESDLDASVYSNVTCTEVNGDVELAGEMPTDGDLSSVAAAAGLASVASLDTSGLFVAEAEVEEVEEVAAVETTTTTAAPETTTTTAAPETTTTTEAPETTTTTEAPVAEPVTMWDALVASGEANQFATIGGALGLQDDLEAMVDADGNPVQRTLFAPSDAAVAALDPATLSALVADPEAAAALVGYHFLDGAVTGEEVLQLNGQTVPTRTGLPLSIAVDGDTVTLNGSATVVTTDYVADNGIVHIIDTILEPPTINEVLALENIEFEVNSDVITPRGQEELQKAIEFFTTQPGVNALIEGHTDTDGSDELNLDLSQRRADSVKAYLVANGVEEGRLTTQGFGESQPILVDGVEDKEASRRIEFVVR